VVLWYAYRSTVLVLVFSLLTSCDRRGDKRMEKDFFLSLEIERRECVTLTLRLVLSRTTATKSTHGRGRLCLALEKISLRISTVSVERRCKREKKISASRSKTAKKGTPCLNVAHTSSGIPYYTLPTDDRSSE